MQYSPQCSDCTSLLQSPWPGLYCRIDSMLLSNPPIGACCVVLCLVCQHASARLACESSHCSPMELNNEVLSSLALINSAHVGPQDLALIFQQCTSNVTTTKQANEQTQSDDKSILRNILSFAISSILFESAKNNVNPTALVKLLQEHKLDCSTDNFKLFINFLTTSWGKINHNLSQLELNPLPKFQGLEWSQMLDIKSSNMDNIKEKSYLLDLYVDAQQDKPDFKQSHESSVFSMTLSQKELQDLHFTLSDCAKSIENFVSK